jgi:hypothetical protein
MMSYLLHKKKPEGIAIRELTADFSTPIVYPTPAAEEEEGKGESKERA